MDKWKTLWGRWKKRMRNRRYLGGSAFFILFSILVMYSCTHVYSSYRKELITTEQNQLLTMARTISKSLVNYVKQELQQVDTYYAGLESWGTKEDQLDVIEASAEYVILHTNLYDGVAVYDYQGNSLGSFGREIGAFPGIPETKEARIVGKELLEEGRYESFIARRAQCGGRGYIIVLSMNLDEIYRQIVQPVKIGNGGYSIVKDGDLSIIMHHARSQIGMDAVYDRRERYPDLDMEDLFRWINLQKEQDEGYDLIQTYVWDDPNLAKLQRIIAYTTAELPGDTWIVNSTLPFEELEEPLTRMLTRLMLVSGCFLILSAGFIITLTRHDQKEKMQEQEIKYLKEINAGMDLIRKKDEELQHYQRVQSIGEMSSHIAHEFNNYLTPIMVYSELLESDPEIGADRKEMLKGILDSAGQAANLSRRLLDFSRQESDVNLTIMDIRNDILSSCDMLRRLAPNTVVFEQEIPEQTIWTRARKGMLEHILMNLSKNAFHAMEKNGDREKRLKVSLKTEGDVHVLRVSDTGCGIPQEAMDKIFEPFYTTKRSGKGTGLGLSVVRNVMVSCGGSVEIHSVVGEGTTFELRFPKLEPKTEEGKKKRGVKRIAVVDDDAQVTKSMQAFLKKNGYHCDAYNHPAALLSAVQSSKRFDVVLTDFDMPAMNGLELAEMLRRLQPDLHIILMSGVENSRFAWYERNLTIDRFFLKSDLTTQLIGELKEY